ncbi:putative bifunctional diguanylate cyclase/phosphodiesterase [Pontibacter sp. JAM-7]|uniref:putative bifunctional diguanylate cyclase/phosphodiesterase n=1 Tax=Pontibacter sp. JAM-7 TaxID=3366581 RepID=UPI003AF6290C
MIRTLSFRISSLIGSLLLLAALAVMVSVWISTFRFAQQQISRDLSVGTKVFEQVMSEREQQLVNSAEVLAADFGFRGAVASRDGGTIVSALENHVSRIEADIMAIISLRGVPEYAVGIDNVALETLQSEVDFSRLVGQGGASIVAPLRGKAYQLVLVPVEAPLPIGVAVIGFEIDNALAASLKRITGLELSFLVEQEGLPDNVISTLPGVTTEALLKTTQLSWATSFSHRPVLQSQTLPIYLGVSGTIDVMLTDDLRRVFSEFDRLQLTIIAIVIFALVVALVAGLLFSRQISRPLRQLVGVTRRIAAGSFKSQLNVKAETREFNDLISAFSNMQDELHEREEKIIFQATHDVTTGVINRQTFTQSIQSCITEGESFYLMGFRVSNFRQINDMFGPSTADKSLISLCDRLKPMVPLVARHGGGSFVAKLDGPCHDQSVKTMSNMVRLAAEADGINVNFEIHIGVVEFPADVEDAHGLMRRLDIAMDSARYAHNGIHFYQAGQEQDYVRRLKIVEDLRSSMRDKGRGLQMYYQPKLHLKTGRVNRAEALIRWIHPEQGFIPPDVFIPLAEQSGLINSLTEWIIGSVAEQVAYWLQLGHSIQVAINLSVQDIAREDMLDIIFHQLRKHKLRPENLAFEITESELMHQPEQAIALLQRFRNSGLELAIDDFGTGYSSLSQLKNMPVNVLKIDREFVMHLSEDVNDQTIVKSTIELADSFELDVVAEGVENIESLDILSGWGCAWAQGYLISRPLPAAEFVSWLQQFSVEDLKPSVSGVVE